MNRLKALQRRFMIINMGTITIMLLIILSIVIIGNMQHYKTVAFESLHTLVNMTNPVNTFSSSSDPGASRFQDANRSATTTRNLFEIRSQGTKGGIRTAWYRCGCR